MASTAIGQVVSEVVTCFHYRTAGIHMLVTDKPVVINIVFLVIPS